MVQVGSDRARRTLGFLRHKISSGEWPINSKIPTEPELMRLIGVGKTTVREAVRSLASVGILEPMPGIGTFVRSRMPVSSVLVDYMSEFSVSDLLGYLTERTRPALEAAGDHELVTAGLARVTDLGNGATRQRRAWRRNHDVDDVLAEAAAATLEDG